MTEIIAIAGIFLLRVGVPIMGLVFVGMMIDRWQTNREAEIMEQYRQNVEFDFKQIQAQAEQVEDQQTRKAA